MLRTVQLPFQYFLLLFDFAIGSHRTRWNSVIIFSDLTEIIYWQIILLISDSFAEIENGGPGELSFRLLDRPYANTCYCILLFGKYDHNAYETLGFTSSLRPTLKKKHRYQNRRP